MKYLFVLLFSLNTYAIDVKWDKKSIDIGISDSVPASLRPKVISAAKTWNKELGREFIVVTDMCASENCIYYTRSYEGPSHQQAVTRAFFSGFITKMLDKALIQINATNFNWEQDVYDFESLILHELGHFVGLQHSDLPESVMYPYLEAGKLRRSLTQTDKKDIKDKYGN